MSFELIPLFVLPFSIPVIMIVIALRKKKQEVSIESIKKYYTENKPEIKKTSSGINFNHQCHNVKCYYSKSNQCECSCKGSLHGKGIITI